VRRWDCVIVVIRWQTHKIKIELFAPAGLKIYTFVLVECEFESMQRF